MAMRKAFMIAVIGLRMLSGARASILAGYIEVNDASHFVGNVLNDFGEYVVTADSTSQLVVTFDPSISPFSMTEVNASGFADDPDPYLGGITGFASTSDFGPGSVNYSYLGGTTATAAKAAPTAGPNSFTAATGIPENIESTIWSLTNGNVLLPQWINTDLSMPSTYVVDSGGVLALTGDPTQFINVFGGNVDTLLFVCTEGCEITTAAPEPSSLILALFGFAILGGLGQAREQARR
jgi:hypothetical protein